MFFETGLNVLVNINNFENPVTWLKKFGVSTQLLTDRQAAKRMIEFVIAI